jgi:diadenosine tetraphosphatase ApaH/serine/threonine PP2A family protein phosphatase
MNIIGDIAGQYDALIRLMKRVPDHETIFIGDLVDRGPDSPAVIDFAIDNEIITIMGNHEHMMLDYYDQTALYNPLIWMSNGGAYTYYQYEAFDPSALISNKLAYHLQWLRNLPKFIETNDLIITHAPVPGHAPDLSQAKRIPLHHDNSLIWNRRDPIKRDRFQIFGHNGHMSSKPDHFLCVDDSMNNVLTCYNTETKLIYQEPY